MTPKSFAVFAAALLLVGAVGPVAATDVDLSIAANQPTVGGEATVTVTDDGTAVENASVGVVATDGNYSGEDDYVTDANGTVTLPPPEENVTIEVTAEYENVTATTTAELLVAPDEGEDEETESFGARVSAYVHSLLNGDEEQQRIGRLIADWVVENNPGNAPDHAGPPEDRGPPASVGTDDADAGGNETDGDATVQTGPGNGGPGGNGNGPPENPGSQGKGNGR